MSNAIDGIEDEEIACFAPGTQLASGRERLRIAMENRNEGECINPFALSDIEDNPPNELDEDSEADDDVEIVKLFDDLSIFLKFLFSMPMSAPPPPPPPLSTLM